MGRVPRRSNYRPTTADTISAPSPCISRLQKWLLLSFWLDWAQNFGFIINESYHWYGFEWTNDLWQFFQTYLCEYSPMRTPRVAWNRPPWFPRAGTPRPFGALEGNPRRHVDLSVSAAAPPPPARSLGTPGTQFRYQVYIGLFYVAVGVEIASLGCGPGFHRFARCLSSTILWPVPAPDSCSAVGPEPPPARGPRSPPACARLLPSGARKQPRPRHRIPPPPGICVLRSPPPLLTLTASLLSPARSQPPKRLCVYVARDFQKGTFKYVWPIRVLRAFVGVFFSTFSVSALQMFLFVLWCQARVPPLARGL